MTQPSRIAALVLSALAALSGLPSAAAGTGAGAASSDRSGTSRDARAGLVIVYDGSLSMWTPMPAFGLALSPASRRFAVAARFSNALIDRTAAAMPGYAAGLFLFGAEQAARCEDRRLAIPFGALSDPDHVARIKARLSELRPKGRTAIAGSIQDAARLLEGYDPATIVLVTDGEEECSERPDAACAAADAAKRANPALVIHVIGVATPRDVLARTACVARSTGGIALSVSDPDDLDLSLTRLTEAFRPPPAAARSTITARAAVERAKTFPNIGQSPSIRILDARTGQPSAATPAPSTPAPSAGAASPATLSETVAAGEYDVEFRLGAASRRKRVAITGAASDATVDITFPVGILTVRATLPGGHPIEGEPDLLWRIELVATADGQTFRPGTQVAAYRAPRLRIAVPPGSYRILATLDGDDWGKDLPPVVVASGEEAVRQIEIR